MVSEDLKAAIARLARENYDGMIREVRDARSGRGGAA